MPKIFWSNPSWNLKFQARILCFSLFLSLFLPPTLSAQTGNLDFLEYRPFRSGSKLVYFKKGEVIFNYTLSPQLKVKHALLDIFFYDNSFIVGQRGDNQKTYHIHRVGIDGSKINSFDIVFPKKSFTGALTMSIGDMALDAKGNLFVIFTGKEPNDPTTTQYMRKYNLEGEQIWERIVKDGSEIKFISRLSSAHQGALGSVPSTPTTLFFGGGESASKRIIFFNRPVESFDQTIHAGKYYYGFKEKNFIYGANQKMYYLSILKKAKESFTFVRSEVNGSEEILELGNLFPKPHWSYHGAVDENGNTIIQYNTKRKEKSAETAKKITLHNSDMLIFDPKGKLIHEISLLKDGSEELKGIKPILATNQQLIYLDKGSIKMCKYDAWPGESLEIVSKEEITTNLSRYGIVYPKFDNGNKSLFRLSENKFALFYQN